MALPVHRHTRVIYHKHKSKIHLLIVLSLLVVLGVIFFLLQLNSNSKLYSYDVTKKAYECPDSRSLLAAYSGDIVNLELSDGRNIVLDHSPKGDNIYSNNEGSFSFWTEGNLAYVQEGNNITYKDCVGK